MPETTTETNTYSDYSRALARATRPETATGHKLLRSATCTGSTRHDVQIDRYGICSWCDIGCTCGSAVTWLDFTDPVCQVSYLIVGYDGDDMGYITEVGEHHA